MAALKAVPLHLGPRSGRPSSFRPRMVAAPTRQVEFIYGRHTGAGRLSKQHENISQQEINTPTESQGRHAAETCLHCAQPLPGSVWYSTLLRDTGTGYRGAPPKYASLNPSALLCPFTLAAETQKAGTTANARTRGLATSMSCQVTDARECHCRWT